MIQTNQLLKWRGSAALASAIRYLGKYVWIIYILFKYSGCIIYGEMNYRGIVWWLYKQNLLIILAKSGWKLKICACHRMQFWCISVLTARGHILIYNIYIYVYIFYGQINFRGTACPYNTYLNTGRFVCLPGTISACQARKKYLYP